MRSGSISTRITIGVCALTFVTAIASTRILFVQFNKQIIESKLHELERETELQTMRFTDLIDESKRDMRVVSGTPIIERILRAHAAGGIDPQDGAHLEILERRLEIVLHELLKNKPHYLQARFIGREDGGRERIRVERDCHGDTIRIVEASELQRKGSSPYFIEAMKAPPDTLYLSPINLNREHGVVQLPICPVLRVAMPVALPGNDPFGAIVVNLAARESLDAIARVPNPNHRYYVADAEGTYLLHPEPDRAFEWVREGVRKSLAYEDFPTLKEALQAGITTHTEVDPRSERVTSIRRVVLGDADDQRALWIIATSSSDYATALTWGAASSPLLIMGGLLALAGATGVWLARSATKPIMALASAVRSIDVESDVLAVPDACTSETRDLASAFSRTLSLARQRAAELESKNHELEQFAYIASHDLQEPVRTVANFVELLIEEHADEFDGEAKQSLEFISASCVRMQTLIHGLLEYSRLGLASSPEEVDLNSVVKDVVQDLTSAIDESGGRIEIDELPTLTGYPLEIRVLFQNLLGNALKFRRPDVPPEVRVRAESQDDGWLFSVTDNGIGIEERYREKVFLIFQRLHNRSTYSGTGIGLAHCSKIVAMHHGRIWVESAPGGGSRFLFRLQAPREAATKPT